LFVFIVSVFNDFYLSIEARERIWLIFFLKLSPVMKLQLISPSWVSEAIPDPLINLFFKVSFLFNQLCSILSDRLDWRHLWHISYQCENFPVYFLYRKKWGLDQLKIFEVSI
jgi:hypothetical protein